MCKQNFDRPNDIFQRKKHSIVFSDNVYRINSSLVKMNLSKKYLHLSVLLGIAFSLFSCLSLFVHDLNLFDCLFF